MPKQSGAVAPELPGPLPTDAPAGGLDVPPPPPKAPADAAEEVAEAFPGEFQLCKEERERWLILHFALPRTIMTCDLAERRSTEAELNDVLSAMAWGSVDAQTGEWRLEAEEPSAAPPEPHLVSYAEHVSRGDGAEARERRAVFTSQGEPGALLRPAFDLLVKSLAHSNKALMRAYDLKRPVLNEEELPEDETRSLAQNIMRFGRHQVLPAFWQLMAQLTRRGRRFSVVFHAFSEEQLSVVQRELHEYCQGKHPAYDGKNKTQKPPPMGGEKGSRDMRLLDGCIGRIDRAGGRLTFAGRPEGDAPKIARPGEAATSGAPEVPPDGEDEEEGAAQFTPTVYSFPPYYEVYAGLQHQVLEGANTAAIIEDVEFWRRTRSESTGEGGQLLLVDSGGASASGLAESRVQHVFFDGHGAERLELRDVVSGGLVPFTAAEGVFAHPVDLYQAVTDIDYFVRAVADCELRFSQRLLESRRPPPALAAGRPEGEDVAQLPAKEYLYRSVIPALLPALEACQRDRPPDPVEYIALYMLRHTQQYSKTLRE